MVQVRYLWSIIEGRETSPGVCKSLDTIEPANAAGQVLESKKLFMPFPICFAAPFPHYMDTARDCALFHFILYKVPVPALPMPSTLKPSFPSLAASTTFLPSKTYMGFLMTRAT